MLIGLYYADCSADFISKGWNILFCPQHQRQRDTKPQDLNWLCPQGILHVQHVLLRDSNWLHWDLLEMKIVIWCITCRAVWNLHVYSSSINNDYSKDYETGMNWIKKEHQDKAWASLLAALLFCFQVRNTTWDVKEKAKVLPLNSRSGRKWGYRCSVAFPCRIVTKHIVRMNPTRQMLTTSLQQAPHSPRHCALSITPATTLQLNTPSLATLQSCMANILFMFITFTTAGYEERQRE